MDRCPIDRCPRTGSETPVEKQRGYIKNRFISLRQKGQGNMEILPLHEARRCHEGRPEPNCQVVLDSQAML